MAKFCTDCGASLADAAKFCNGCGAKQDDAPIASQQQVHAQPQYQQPPIQQPYQQPQPQYPQTQPQYQQPQPQYQQPPVQQQYHQPPQQPPQMKQKKKRRIPLPVKIIGIIVLLIAVGVTVAVIALNSAGNSDYYTIGKDKIPSVKLALGEDRKLTGTSSSTALGGGQTKVFEYQVSGSEQNDDMFDYLTYLREKDGFLLLTGFDFNGSKGSCIVGRNSVDAGYEIQLQIEYDRSGYTITILKQEGGISPVSPGIGDQASAQTGNPGGGTGNSQSPGTDNSGTSGTGNNQSPGPDNSGTAGTGGLTKDIFDIVDSGTYYLKLNIIISDEDEVTMEFFAKNGMNAAYMDYGGMEMKFIEKGGKTYTVLYTFEMVIVADATPDDDVGYDIKLENMVYIGEGSGDFRGRTYKYDEFRGQDGEQIFYYVDGSALIGIRTISRGEISEVEVLALNKNVPDDAFEFPEEFEIGEE